MDDTSLIAFIISFAINNIPAVIARKKGRSYLLWLLFSLFLFPAALIAVLFVPRIDVSKKKIEEEKNNVYAVCAGYCFAIILIMYIPYLIMMIQYGGGVFYSSIIHRLILFAFATILFIRKKNMAVVVACGALVLYELYSIIISPSPRKLIALVAVSSLLLLAVAFCIPKATSLRAYAKKFFYLPGVFELLYYLIFWITNEMFNFEDLISIIFRQVPIIIAFFLIGKWLLGGESVSSALPVKNTVAESD